MIKFVNYFFQSLIIYLFFIIGKIIGLKLSREFYGFIFLNIAPFFKSKKIIRDNLRNLSKKIDERKAKIIISNMWKNYGMTFIEYIFLKDFRNSSTHIKIEGQNNIDQIKKRGKPVIFVSGHFSNYELMSMEITKKEIKLATIYRPLNNYFLNPFMEYLRRKFVCQNQIKKGIKGVREAIEYIKKDHSIALMIDQRVSEGEKINFFGKPALTTTLPAQLALKYKLSIYPVYIERLENNDFKVKFLNEIKSTEFDNKIKLTEKLNRELEKMIIDNPNQWIWTHNRWK
tara:strand:- start:4511 stop:5368 length:858 start_codon:yes stop_codon:yes gene_type:complete